MGRRENRIGVLDSLILRIEIEEQKLVTKFIWDFVDHLCIKSSKHDKNILVRRGDISFLRDFLGDLRFYAILLYTLRPFNGTFKNDTPFLFVIKSAGHFCALVL